MLPTAEIQQRLAKQSSLVALAEPGYLKKSDNYSFILKRIFGISETTFIDGVSMAQLLVETGIFTSISGAYSDIIWTHSMIDTVMIRKFIDSFIGTDMVAVKLISNGEKNEIEVIPAGQFFPITIDWTTVWSEIHIYNEDKTNYAFIRTFFTWYNELKLYKFSELSTIDTGEEIPLDSLEITKSLEPIEKTWMSIPAIHVNMKWERFFEKIKTLADSIDRKVNELEMEFYRHNDAYVLFQGVSIPDRAIVNGKIDKMQMGKMFFSDVDTSDIKFITNDNPMIDKALEYISKDIERISSITKVPLEFLGEATKEGAIGGESRQLRLSLFFAKVVNIREAIDEAVKILLPNISFTWWPIVGYENTTNTWTPQTAQGNNSGSAKK